MKVIKFTDVVNWSRIQTVGGIVVSVACFLLSHFGHVSILTKTSADTAFNWNVVNVELGVASVAALVALVAGWIGTEGREAISLNTPDPAKAAEDETVEVLLQKIEHRCRKDAADAIMNAGGTR